MVLLSRYLLAARRSGSLLAPLLDPLSIAYPSKYSYFGVGPRDASALDWYFVTWTIELCVLVSICWRETDGPISISLYTDMCGKSTQEECDNNHVPRWAQPLCTRLNATYYGQCEAEAPWWFVCQSGIPGCGFDQNFTQRYYDLFSNSTENNLSDLARLIVDTPVWTAAEFLYDFFCWAMIGICGVLSTVVGAVLLGYRRTCLWSIPPDEALLDVIHTRAEELKTKLQTGMTTGQTVSKRIFLDVLLMYFDMVNDAWNLCALIAGGHVYFALLKATIALSSSWKEFHRGGPQKLYVAARDSFKLGIYTDEYFYLKHTEISLEALPTLLVDAYAAFQLVSSNVTFLTFSVSVGLSCRSLAEMAWIENDLGLQYLLSSSSASISKESSPASSTMSSSSEYDEESEAFLRSL